MRGGPHSYPAERLLPNGTLESAARVLRRELIEELGLKPRDIVALFSQQGRLGFDLRVRRGGLLVSLGKDGPTVIVGQQVAWILAGGSFLETGKDIQTRYGEIAGMALLPSVPFALGVTEALLMMFLDLLKARLQRATADGRPLIRGFYNPSAEVSIVQLEALRRTKQRLDLLRAQAKAFQQALFELLEDDEDMSALPLADMASKEEWELCFEYYLQNAEEVGLEAQQILEGLEDLESTISLRLSARRLELEKVQLYLDVLGNGLGVGALLTGAFGMNLVSGLEERRRLFWPIFWMILMCSGGVCMGLRLLVKRRLTRDLGRPDWWRPGSQTGAPQSQLSSPRGRHGK